MKQITISKLDDIIDTLLKSQTKTVMNAYYQEGFNTALKLLKEIIHDPNAPRSYQERK